MKKRHKTYNLMNTIIKTIVYIIVAFTTIGATYAQGLELSEGQNYMMAVKAQEPFTAVTELETAPQEQKIYNITYYDGLGRPMQQTAINGSPNSKDIITHIGYDGYGRQTRQHLPYVDTTGVTGNYREVNINNNINGYYQNKYPDDFPGITDLNQINAYSESVFESSPLNRVQKQGAPGAAWKANPNSDIDHTIKFDWGTNTANEVIYFKVKFADATNTELPSLEKVDFYSPAELRVTITKDENWQPGQTHPDDHTTKEYANKLGRVILKRTYNEGLVHDTYYVYDGFGNLSFVLPPKVDTTDGVSDIELAELCYQYRYDYRNRLIEKKIPGKGWEYIMYNNLDQPVMTQDANMRKENSGKTKDEWLFTKYDAFGRVAYTGKIEDDRDKDVLQTELNNFTASLWVESSNANTIGGANMYYTNGGYPNTQNAEVLTINYYDDYTFLGNTPAPQLGNPGTVYNEPVSNNTKSLATGSKVKVLGTNQWITTVTYYDKKARPICITTTNEYLNTSDIVESKLDFIGKIEENTTRHNKEGHSEIVTIDKFIYDHIGRVMKQTQKINTQAEEVIAENEYDELGQLTNKKVGGTLSGAEGLQTVNYNYNIRGWLKSINEGITANGDLFGFAIEYNTGANPLYNGNIAKTAWQTQSINPNSPNNPVSSSYTYTYDALNRILSATDNTNNYNLSNISYDKNGNILSLTRKGLSDPTNNIFGDMDVLSYNYGNNNSSNTLIKVEDSSGSLEGFVNGVDIAEEYAYDANGNMTIDQNKGITGITYNHLNLPETVAISNSEGTGNISYIYDATGAKLKKIAPSGGSFTETEYAGNYVYKNGNLEFFNHPEGIVEKEADGYKYVYQFKDHLDNIRLSYKDANKDGTITQDEIVQEKNYYPFGLEHKGYNNTIVGVPHDYSFNNKEFDQSLNLNTFDLGARQYDPAIGRFMVIDPMADFINNQSPYMFANNNPIQFVDDFGFGKCGWLCRAFNKLIFGKNNLLPDGTREKKFSRATGNRRNNEKKKKGTIDRPNPSGLPTKNTSILAGNDLNFNPASIAVQSLELPQLSLPDIQTPNPRQPAIPQFEGREFRTRINVPTHIQFTGDGTDLAIDAMTKRTLNAIIKTLTDYPQVKLEVYVNYTGVNSLRNDPNFEQRARSQSSKRGRKIVEFLLRRGVSPGRVRARQGEVIFEKRKQGNTRRNTQNFRIINPKQ